jgi:hypothetical protein
MSAGTKNYDGLVVALRDRTLEEIEAKRYSVPREGLDLQQKHDYLVDQPRVILVTNAGTMMNGIIISPEQFATLNQQRHGGSFADEFDVSCGPNEEPEDFIFLADIMFWTGLGESGWKRASSQFPGILLRIPMKDINCCGDNF